MHVVGQQQRTDQALAMIEQAVDARGALVAVALKLVHARTRSGGERSLGGGEDAGEQRQHDGDKNGGADSGENFMSLHGLLEESDDGGGVCVLLHERLADAAREDERQVAGFVLLVGGHQFWRDFAGSNGAPGRLRMSVMKPARIEMRA